MKSPITAMTLVCTLAASVVLAQGIAPRGRGAMSPAAPAATDRPPAPADHRATVGAAPAAGAPAPKDPDLASATTVLPTPVAPDQIKSATIALPTDPIEPYLLTKNEGPFLVLAKTFRGPDAERYALALVLELRRDYGLPAFILRTKDFPRLSNIRNVPPTAPASVEKPHLTDPEKVRTYDEAAVLVGNEKTLDDQEALWKKVKKIKPNCLNRMPGIFHWREGLGKALRTTNPFVPAQNIYPGRKRDPLIAQMNEGPRSIFRCPGRYTLQVAEFGGRASFNPQDPRFQGSDFLKKSPLATAAEDAEKLAEALAKDPEVRKAGVQPYVYHDRTTSRVTIGSFQSPDDPSAVQLRQLLLSRAVDLSQNSKKTMIVPAPYLTDLEPIKSAQ
jgi:hypothetical protein